LFDYAPRYARVVKGLGFGAPTAVEQFEVRERVQGDAGTDMGSLSGIEPAYDSTPVEQRDHEWLIKILEACWHALDRAARAAQGRELRKGAIGGGGALQARV
jgi:hypothetical protein